MYSVGMTGFDSVNNEVRLPRSGIAEVPVTHFLRNISAKQQFASLSTVKARFARMAPVMPAFSFALTA